jgi:hypothetical protein
MTQPLHSSSTPSQLPLALVAPSPHRLCRRSDGGGSAAAAAEAVGSGRDASQVLWVIGLVTMFPGRSSKELARETETMARDRFGISADRWRYLIARRLSEAEDEGRGPIVGCQNSPNASRPYRLMNPTQAKCRYAEARCIRWLPNSNSKGAS